jgi:hypothetical protein
MVRKFAQLRSAMAPAARARAAKSANKMLAKMTSASPPGGVHKRRPDFLKIAATSASVSHREALTADELARILLSGDVPPRFLPHLRVVLEELSPSVVEGVVEQLAERMTPDRLRKVLAAMARQVGVSRRKPTA